MFADRTLYIICSGQGGVSLDVFEDNSLLLVTVMNLVSVYTPTPILPIQRVCILLQAGQEFVSGFLYSAGASISILTSYAQLLQAYTKTRLFLSSLGYRMSLLSGQNRNFGPLLSVAPPIRSPGAMTSSSSAKTSPRPPADGTSSINSWHVCAQTALWTVCC